MKAVRAVGGFLLGYGVSLASSLAWFHFSGRSPYLPQPGWFIAATSIYGILFAIVAGYIGAWIGGYGAGFAIGVAMAVLSILSLLTDRGAHWSQYLSLVLMAPATVLGAKLGVGRQAVRS